MPVARSNVLEFHLVPLCSTTVRQDLPADFSWASCIYGKTGDSAMHVAARSGHVDIIEFLQGECSMSLELQNFEGKRPLHDAAQFGQEDCVEYLVKKGVEIDPLKRADWTPLMLAATKSSLKIIRLLFQSGARLQLTNKDGWTAFHLACREGVVDIVGYLLDKDHHLWGNVSTNGRTPLHTAALHGHLEVVKLLIDRGEFAADVTDNCGTTPFMDAIRAGHLDIADWLFRTQLANLETRDKLGRRAIHLAAQAGSLESIRLLIRDYGEDPNIPATLDLATPLHCAAREGQAAAVELLLNLGSDPSLQDSHGRIPAKLAEECRHFNCAGILSKMTERSN